MSSHSVNIGWAETGLTPQRPVSLSGSTSPRFSEGVADPLYATAWAIDSGEEQAVFVSCDLVVISDELRDAVRSRLARQENVLDPMKVIIHATHTHNAPEIRPENLTKENIGFALHEVSADIMSVEEYLAFASDRIAEAVKQAWNSRAPGGIAYGMEYAVIGRNRRWVDMDGHSTMHGLNPSTADRFRHIEGYEDHSLYVLATYDADSKLTGLILNFACTAQVPGATDSHKMSADIWHEARRELRSRFGSELFILPQVSAAGEQTGHLQYDKAAESRMLRLKGRSKRQDVAISMANAIAEMLPAISQEIQPSPAMRHQVDVVHLTANRLTEEDVQTAEREASEWEAKYEQAKDHLEKHPELRLTPRWYESISIPRRKIKWLRGVSKRFERQKEHATLPAEVHVLRLGEVLFASVPFEYYLDYGIQIKVRSPATQTFLVQLAGPGTYVPSPRSLLGGGYGSTAPSNPIGAEGGQELAEHIVQTIRSVWNEA
ncbi:MAG: hypothetical protein K0Q59_821 [Paenibacillus sp.]|nr:hypothetical protein [Paenibacillus sp.]